jgi:hypothetical protein
MVKVTKIAKLLCLEELNDVDAAVKKQSLPCPCQELKQGNPDRCLITTLTELPRLAYTTVYDIWCRMAGFVKDGLK